MPNLPARVLFDFLVKDFERAWNAMALAEFDEEVGGNFLFTRQAMILLELVSRVASPDPALLRAFSSEIERFDWRYFMPLPAELERWPKQFDLPSSKSQGPPACQLLPVLFDLVRHGQLHYGEQVTVLLADGKYFGVSLGGVSPGVTLEKLQREPGSSFIDHLVFRKRLAGHFELWLSPGVLFLTLRQAAERAGVFASDVKVDPFERKWRTTSADLEEAIRRSGALLWEEEEEASVLRPFG